jgi:hypothetical protein
MPVLKNPKHEKFAQELAKGKSADQAYKVTDYKAHRGNAWRLSANERIQARVRERSSAGRLTRRKARSTRSSPNCASSPLPIWATTSPSIATARLSSP